MQGVMNKDKLYRNNSVNEKHTKTYNHLCQTCIYDCKQSTCCRVIECPIYEPCINDGNTEGR